ncbi:MAG: NAD(P)H-binding protein [Gemmatimonadales bacterium]
MRIAMTGATGYVGSAVLSKLLRRDHEVRALARQPERAERLRDLGVELVAGDLGSRTALAALVKGADAVVHLVGIIAETALQTFEAVHVRGTEALLDAAREAGVGLFVHMSALGARGDAGATRYHRTKWRSEEAVCGSGLAHVIVRPSLIAGPGNAPIGMMVNMIRFSPVVPVIGDGRYEMQPVWIGDVAEVVALALERPEIRGSLDIGGAERLTYHQMLDHLEAALGVQRRRVRVPVGIARFAAGAGTALPNLAPITPDQLQMLLEGNTTVNNALESRFGVRPRPFAEVAREICAPYATRPAVS